MDYYDENILPPIQTPKGKYGVQIPELKNESAGITVPKVQLIKVTPETVNKKVKIPAAPEESQKPALNSVEIMRDPSVDIRDQKPYQKVHPYEISKEKTKHIQRKLAVMDDPIIGGKLTVCVLCYGPHTELARKCLGSLFASIPADRLDVRVATNQVPQATIDYLRTLPITKLYINSENRHKYPVMREMLYDEKRPIETNYFMWLDDDTWVVKPQWIDDLCQTIINNHHYNFRMYGNLMYHDLKHYSKNGGRPDQWFKAARVVSQQTIPCSWRSGRSTEWKRNRFCSRMVLGDGDRGNAGCKRTLSAFRSQRWRYYDRRADAPSRIRHKTVESGQKFDRVPVSRARRTQRLFRKVSMGPQQVILDHNIIMQLWSDPFFWEMVPELESDREMAEAVLVEAEEAQSSLIVKSSSLYNSWIDIITRWATSRPEVVKQITDYIHEKRGCKPEVIKLTSGMILSRGHGAVR